MNLANEEELRDVEHRPKLRRSKSRQVHLKDDVTMKVKEPERDRGHDKDGQSGWFNPMDILPTLSAATKKPCD